MRAPAITLLLIGLAQPVLAQTAQPAPRIYSCTLPDGRKLTSDRPIPECLAREQRLHRSDGSIRGSLPPAMSLEEKAAAEVRARAEAAQRAAIADATRHDRNLLARYPRQERHDAARQAALDDIVKATATSERRLQELAKERKVLDDEAEFYKGRSLPAKLRQQVDANDAAVEAQNFIISQQGVERARVNRRYDVELARLKKLWAGAAPGSLGPAPSAKDLELPQSATAAASAAAPKSSAERP